MATLLSNCTQKEQQATNDKLTSVPLCGLSCWRGLPTTLSPEKKRRLTWECESHQKMQTIVVPTRLATCSQGWRGPSKTSMSQNHSISGSFSSFLFSCLSFFLSNNRRNNTGPGFLDYKTGETNIPPLSPPQEKKFFFWQFRNPPAFCFCSASFVLAELFKFQRVGNFGKNVWIITLPKVPAPRTLSFSTEWQTQRNSKIPKPRHLRSVSNFWQFWHKGWSMG